MLGVSRRVAQAIYFLLLKGQGHLVTRGVERGGPQASLALLVAPKAFAKALRLRKGSKRFKSA